MSDNEATVSSNDSDDMVMSNIHDGTSDEAVLYFISVSKSFLKTVKALSP